MNSNNDFLGLNESYVAIIRAQWQTDPLSVPDEWAQIFGTKKDIKISQEVKSDGVPLIGLAGKIVENMELSLSLPTASSFRDIAVKILEENRTIINEHLEDEARDRCSFTHLVAFAVIQAVKANPAMNNSFLRQDPKPLKIIHKDINLGLAIDLPARDGGRVLVVPNLKSCQNMDFWTFYQGYNDIVLRARQSKLVPEDFQDTTLTLTNPGGLGTVLSVPRLMAGQGTIVATGRIGFPAQYEGSSPETLSGLGVGKVMTVSSTYDHRVIQGAESGRFLAYLNDLLLGEDGFYEQVFASLKISHNPYVLRKDRAIVLGQGAGITETERAMRVSQMIHAYRVRGYLLANVDPLHLTKKGHEELDLETYGITVWDLDRQFETLAVLSEKSALLRTILRRLRRSYCRHTGVEYMFIHQPEHKRWVQQKVESEAEKFSQAEKKQILGKLLQAEGFELFLQKRYVGHKRFGIEGAEIVIPMLHELLNLAAIQGVSDVVMGMAHRGRLNVLANIVGKPYEAIFAEFDNIDPRTFQGSGDVKYHLGAKGVHRFIGDGGACEVRVELACNPSHLEAVDPIVEGIVRGRQHTVGDRDGNKVIPVLIHGDAAFAGQGVVYETMQLSGLEGYKTGGTVHIIINNQIGYTTPPEKARTSLNCSDLARAIGVPVFRVNGDDPEACIRATRTAFEFRMQFGRDVVIDLVCYRRHGHNEGDEPGFTQPILYEAIKKHPSVTTIYGELLVRRKDIATEELERIRTAYHEIFDQALEAVRSKGQEAISEQHELFRGRVEPDTIENPVTGVDLDVLRKIAEFTSSEPKTIEVHPRIQTLVLQRRKAMVFDGSPLVDFGMAEILAYGSLILEGISVRMSGQDVGRGTFAHRHAVLYDIKDGHPYIPLSQLKDESLFQIYDSPLSEAAVLGFEYGYSVEHLSSLVIWEAQFGDFFNGAQIQIDQFIASAEAKWGQKSRLVLLLPHGSDGQGPEHSSARIERFLLQCAQNNMRVANVSTPAQFFHLLRRQAKQPKKPLIVFTHKSILRAEDASSHLDEFVSGKFSEVLLDSISTNQKSVKRLVFCSGKIYWELDRWRKKNPERASNIVVARLEQLYPFPRSAVVQVLKNVQTDEVIWLQEESKNNGAFRHLEPIFSGLGVSLRYVGRAESASPAPGSHTVHDRQQGAILQACFESAAIKRDLEIQ